MLQQLVGVKAGEEEEKSCPQHQPLQSGFMDLDYVNFDAHARAL